MISPESIICAVRTESEFAAAINSKHNIVFDLNPDIITMASRAKKAHAKGKKLFIHIDLAKGVGKDECGIKYISLAGVDGIISTKNNLIKLAREQGLCTVQRFFMVDSRSFDTAIEAMKASKPSMIEIMPGVLSKVIRKMSSITDTKVIAGGLIESESEVNEALLSGAFAISTGSTELWDKE